MRAEGVAEVEIHSAHLRFEVAVLMAGALLAADLGPLDNDTLLLKYGCVRLCGCAQCGALWLCV